jgi:uncharacterized membrane protein
MQRTLATLWMGVAAGLVLIPAALGGYPLNTLGAVNLRPFLQGAGLILLLAGALDAGFRAKLLNLSQQGADRAARWITLAYAIILIKSAWLTYFAFEINAVDFSIFDHLIPNTARGQFMVSAACSGCNQFGHHSMPLMLLLYPLHRLFDHPLLFVTLHPIALAASLVPAWSIARSRLDRPIHALLAWLVLPLLPWMAAIQNYGFHLEVFYLPFLLWTFALTEKGRWRLALLPALLTLLIKEDAAIYLGAYAFALAVLRLAPARFLMGLSVLCAISAAANFLWIMPSNHPSGTLRVIGTASRFGTSLPEILRGLLQSWPTVLGEIAGGAWLKGLAPLLGLPLLSPLFLLATAPFILIHSTAAAPPMRELGLYYSAPFVPWVFLAFVQVGPRLEGMRVLQRFGLRVRTLPILIMVLGLVLAAGPRYRLPVPHEDSGRMREVIGALYRHGPLCAQGAIFPHLPYRAELKLLDENCLGDPNASILMHRGLNPYPFDAATLSSWRERLADDDTRQAQAFGGIELFQPRR